ncbi:MAG: helix-turn-helix transcriptional regulator [Solirubrobacterales bacterium]|nr:helix-turn-helix transcriptional regulator [Solirubrobacterales bacterium]
MELIERREIVDVQRIGIKPRLAERTKQQAADLRPSVVSRAADRPVIWVKPAQRNQAEIAQTARRLFVERGYGMTTISDIAEATSVSPETIYKAFRSKRALLDAAITAAIRGDNETTPLRSRPVIDAIRQEQDPRRQLEMYGNFLAEVNPQLAPLVRVMRDAATSDADVAAALTQLKADRLDGMSEFAALLAARGALRHGLSQTQAADVLWTLNSPELYELLVLERRWNKRRYAQWVTHQLAAALLD